MSSLKLLDRILPIFTVRRSRTLSCGVVRLNVISAKMTVWFARGRITYFALQIADTIEGFCYLNGKMIRSMFILSS